MCFFYIPNNSIFAARKKIMKKSIILYIFIITSISVGYSQERVSVQNLKKHISYLASDDLEGRLPGSKGDSLTLKYIVNQLKSYGFTSFFDKELLQFSYINKRVPDSTVNVSINGDELTIGKDYVIPPYSGSSKITSLINIKKDDDTTSGVMAGSAVLLKSDNEKVKMIAVKYAQMGASAILFYNPGENNFNYSTSDFSSQLSIPVIYLSPSAAEQIISYGISYINASINLYNIRTYTNNVVMVLKSKNSNGSILIGAHHDHLGKGQYSSRKPGSNEVHNGADDNASGVSAVLETARIFSKNKSKLKHNLIIATFGAEERGLFGSKFLADSLKKLGKTPILMINLDMVGRLNEDKIQVGGTGTFPGSDSIIALANSKNFLKVATTKGGTGASDHSSFYNTGSSVLYLTTGVHQQYHTPEDDETLINYEGMAKVTSLVYDIAEIVASGKFMPQFSKVEDEAEPVRSSFKVSLGVVPDFTYEEGDGFRIGAVSPGRPAMKAGLIAGDIITSMNGKKVKNIYEYMAGLNELEAGKKVEVEVKREGKILKFTIEL